MDEQWPASLQQKLNETNFSLTPVDTTITTEMDVSVAKKRRRYTKNLEDLNCSIDLENDDYSILDNFFHVTLNGGVNVFTFIHPITQVEERFRFKEPYQITVLGGEYFRVNMTWEKLP